MSGATYPPNLLAAIASGAGGSYITNPMPLAPTGTNAASIQGGMPPITMQPELSGGEPPLGQDVNGFYFLLSSHTLFVECGQGYNFNSTLATAIGGYLAGSVLAMLDGTGFWLCTTNGNSNDPDAGGAGWVPLSAYGNTTINSSSASGGIIALTPAQSKYGVIIINGALTANLIVQFPQTLQSWLVVNNTTGAFAVTVQTAASGSTGVAVPQGGLSSPTGIYSIGDGNIYPSFAPLTVPISQAATPLTLAERTNAGYILATYFNQSSGLETPAIGSVFVQNTAADGYLRKVANASFISGLGLVTSTSLAATLAAYAALSGPTFTGIPKAPTAAPGTSTTQLATTAFASIASQITFGKTANNTAVAPGGWLVKWGLVAQTVGGNQNHAFPVAFPTACLWVGAGVADSTGVEFSGVVSSGTAANQFEFYANNTCNVWYLAIGY